MAIVKFRELQIWQKAHLFVLEVYKYTKNLPKEETFSLTAQFKRAAISVAANIAEGYKKKGKADKVRLMNVSQGSVEECQYYLILSRELAYGNHSYMCTLLDEVSKMPDSYI